jgi:hypothetical protein
MHKFKKEITIVIEGETTKEDLNEEELFKNLRINYVNWWESHPSWPYGKPCKEMRGVEIISINIKPNY